MAWFWVFLGVLLVVAGARYLVRRRASRAARHPRVDDDALRRILETGSLASGDDDEPLDMDAAARAEEEFWGESWDEPDEFRP